MRILFLSSFYPPDTRGGAEVSTQYIAQGLADRGHTVHVITAGKKREEQIMNGISVARLPLPFQNKPLFEKGFSQKIAREIKAELDMREAYKIIHAHDFRTAAVLAELKFPQTFITARDYAAICGPTNFILANGNIGDCCNWNNLMFNNPRIKEASLGRKFFRMWQYKYNLKYRRQVYTSITNQIFTSHAQQNLLNKHLPVPEAKQTVIYNPVGEAYLKEPLKMGDEQRVAYIGTIDFYKGLGVLLPAWKVIAKQFNHVHLHIIGEGSQKIRYENYVQKEALGYRVTFEGRMPVHQIQRAYDQSAIVVAPHQWIEPFGRTVVEAMARGKIVVTTNAGGPAEIVQHEKTGLLFERGSVEALTKTLRYALQLPYLQRQQIGQAAQQWVRNNLTIAKIAEQYEEFYRN